MIPYVTTRQIKVDLWQAGLLYHMLQILIFVFYGRSIVLQGDWLLSVPINGHAVAYAVGFDAASRPSTQPYCSNPAYNYTFSENFKYMQPSCQTERVEVSVTKRKNYVSFSSVFIEKQDFSFPCSDFDSAAAKSGRLACTGGAFPPVIDNGQGHCTCEFQRTIFPFDIEQNAVEFSSIYNVRDLKDTSWDGNSEVSDPPGGHPHDYKVEWPNGTVTQIPAGQPINLALREIIRLAGQQSLGENMTNFSLDLTNNFVKQDVTGSGQYPTYRVTGLDIQV